VRTLTLRIERSQADEMELMREWLHRRNEALPPEHDHSHGAASMPGMLTADEMQRMAAADGAAFDRLFLEGMIQHHEGALIMVRALFATPGAGQESELFAFASDVDADQRMEIGRMRAMLERMQP
jgi:uncharacterized protein (DUF305 family)